MDPVADPGFSTPKGRKLGRRPLRAAGKRLVSQMAAHKYDQGNPICHVIGVYQAQKSWIIFKARIIKHFTFTLLQFHSTSRLDNCLIMIATYRTSFEMSLATFDVKRGH